MKISLILPVYNVEKYVKECLLSCLNQDITSNNYEIIIVNDGTKDSSLDIVSEIAKNYINITIVSQENAGLSVARNKGLSLAKGDYVWFIDTDDYIQENCLGSIVTKLESDNLDALSISGANVYEGKVNRRISYNNTEFSTGIDALLKKQYSICVPFTIYRRQFILSNNLNFMVGVFHEDNEFTPRAYYYLERVGVHNDIVYFVRQNPTSITRSLNPKKSYDCIAVAKSLVEFANTIVSPELKPKFYGLISTVINDSFHNILKSSDPDTIKLFNKYLYANRTIFKYLRYSPVLKNRIEGILFVLFPKHALLIFRFLLLFKL